MTLPGLVAANNLSDVVDRERAWDNLGSSVSTNIPIPSPSLDLNFAANKSLVDDISGNNLITFSRASTGTFVGSNGLLQTAASGVPRFDHNPTTGESLGLLVEEARTNLLQYSEQFDNAYWVKDNSTITANAIAAPDGQSTADALIENTANSNHSFRSDNFGGAANTTYTFSVYVKAAGRSFVQLVYGQSSAWGNQYANFNLILGTVTLQVGVGSARIDPCPNGWYKISITGTRNSNSGVTYAYVFTGIASDNFSYTGDGTSGIYIWGAQVEAGAFPTSYIPTVASTVTRAADVASITGANFSSWYRADQGTWFGSMSATAKGFRLLEARGPGANDISVSIRPDTANTRCAFLGGTSGATFVTYSGSPVKIGAGYGSGSIRGAANGTLANLVTTGDHSSSTLLNIGHLPSESLYLNGTIARLAYYPARLADLALQYLTSASGSPSSTTYPYTFTIKGKDTLALNSASNASTRDFVFIKGLSTSAQSRLTTIAQQVASGTVFQDAAMLKASPTTSGNYFFSSGITLSGVSTRINGTPALSIATSPFSGSTATASILLRELQPQTNWRITEPMPSGTIASPEFAIPFETNDFVLFMKAGQN
jgi:hypothetical protein